MNNNNQWGQKALWVELSWSEHGADYAQLVGLIPVWAIP